MSRWPSGPLSSIVRAIYLPHVLFLCSQNKLRSPTAEKVFFGWEGIEVASAGLNAGAVNPLSSDLLEWADVVFVMERGHQKKLTKVFRSFITTQRIICLDIPDEFEYMDPALIQILKTKVGPHLSRLSGGSAGCP
jgi:predicted protein tyrosine phosphatase